MTRTIKMIAVISLLLVLPLALPAGKPGPPPPPPDPAIAYVTGWALMAMNADGTNQRTILPAQNNVYHFNPTWSPDGTQLTFASNIQGLGVYVVNVDGTGLRKVVSVASDLYHIDVIMPAWSPLPLGTQFKIAFSDLGAGGKDDLFAVNLDGSELVNLTNTATLLERYASWDPLATRVAAVEMGSGGGNDKLMVYNLAFLDGVLAITGQTSLTSSGPLQGYYFLYPEWAKTRDKIVIPAEPAGGGDFDLWVVDVNDPSSAVPLTNTSDISELKPSWSPDDAKIVYTRPNTTGKFCLFVMNADGSGVQQLAAPKRNNTMQGPDWRRNP